MIANEDIRNARRAYSKYLLNELDDEIAASTPRWVDYVEVLRRIQTTRFTRQVFDEAYDDLSKRGISLDLSADELLAFFYRYSIIGFERASGAAGLDWQFRYTDETIRFNPDARSFMVHRGLKEALELRDAGDAIESLE